MSGLGEKGFPRYVFNTLAAQFLEASLIAIINVLVGPKIRFVKDKGLQVRNKTTGKYHTLEGDGIMGVAPLLNPEGED